MYVYSIVYAYENVHINILEEMLVMTAKDDPKNLNLRINFLKVFIPEQLN
jgi:hypothetical protein